MTDADRQRMLAVLMQGVEGAPAVVYREMEEMFLEDLHRIEPIIDAIAARGRPGPGTGFDHIWRWKTRLPARFGKRCRILSQSPQGRVWIEFESDHWRTVCSSYAIRPAETPAPQQQMSMEEA